MPLTPIRPFSACQPPRLVRWGLSVAMLLLCGLSANVLWHWFTSGPSLSIQGYAVPMAPSTAIVFALLALTVGAYPHWAARGGFRWVILGAAGVASAVSLLVFFRALGLTELSGELWLARTEATVAGGIPIGRMSVLTAVLFVFVAFGLVTLLPVFATKPHVRRLARGLMWLCVGFSGVTALMYAAGVPLFYRQGIVPMALSTAVAMTILSVGVLIVGRDSPGLAREMKDRLLLGFVAVVGLLAFVATTAYVGLRGIRESQRLLVTNNLANVYDLVQFRSNINAERLDIAMMLILPPAEWGPWQGDVEKRSRDDDEILGRLATRFAGNPAVLRRIAALVESHHGFIQARRSEVLAPLLAGEVAQAKATFLGPQVRHHSAMRDLARQLEQAETEEARTVVAETDRRARAFTGIFTTVGATSFVGAVLLGFVMHREIARYVIERRIAEDALRRNAAFLQQTQSVTHMGGWEYDVPARRLHWDAEVRRLHEVPDDYDPNDLQQAMAFSPGESGAQLDQAFQRAVATGEPYDLELELVTAQGRHRWVRTIGRAEIAAGAVTRVYGSIIDITERKDAQRVIERANAYNRTLLEATLDPLVAIGADGRITDVNIATETATGRSRAELVGTDFADYFTDPTRARAGYRHVFEEGFVRDYALELRHRDGHTRSVIYNASVYRDEQGKIAGVLAAARDVTERKRAEDEIRRLNAQLEQRVQERTAELQAANKELETFAYSVSHDLRAPLRSIDGFSRIVQEDCADKLDAENRGHLDRVRAASQRMGALIDDMLRLSRTVRQEMRCAPLDLGALARETLAGLQQTSPDRRVAWTVAPGLSGWGDRTLIRAVLENLLGNAWKFTASRPDARIEFGAVDQDGGRVFFIRDNGAGFDPAYVGKLFCPFQRLHAQEEFPGNGVGLATVHRIVHRHGGRVWAEGKVDAGATFYFTLPAQPINP